MTRILVQRGSAGGSSSNPNRNPSLSSSSTRTENQGSSRALSTLKDEDIGEVTREQVAADEFLERSGSADSKTIRASDDLEGGFQNDQLESSSAENVYNNPCSSDNVDSCELEGLSGLRVAERCSIEKEGLSGDSSHSRVSPPPPPPPMLPPKFLTANSNARRSISGNSNAVRIGPSRRAVGRSLASTRALPSESLPSSPRSHGEYEGYNSADEQSPSFGSSYDNLERECQFENDIRLVKGYEVKHMLEDGNCLFRAVADQVYGDSELHDLARQMCIDYMEHERDHFAQFITEGFSSYCKRKRRDKVYGNNIEIQAFAEMYNRPIHIYSYSTEPINIFHGSYNTESPPLRLSYHRGNHYNSLVDPRRLAVGAGLGFSSLRGANVGKDQVKAAIKAQQDHQIDNALLAEGRFYSDMELTEKEIERMVMEASRKEYLADDKFKQQSGTRKSSSDAEPSSSGARPPSRSEKKAEPGFPDVILSSSSIQMVLSMGFNYLKVIEAYSIFGDDVDSMVCYLLETGGGSRLKGKATE